MGQLKKQDFAGKALERVKVLNETGGLKTFKEYSPENALKAAVLILQDKKNKSGVSVLDACTESSIYNSLLKMVVLGLNPYKHGSFIAYGNELSFSPEYTGDVYIAKRDAGVVDVNAQAVYQGDIFEHEINTDTGVKSVIKHEQKLENLSNPVIGAYVFVKYFDGKTKVEIMNMQQIKKSWGMRLGKGLTKAHTDFPDEMAKKTVTRRALKVDTKSSGDESLFSAKKNPVVEKELEIKVKEPEKFEEVEILDAAEVEKLAEENEIPAAF